MYQDSMRVQSVLQFDTYILSSCLRSWNAPLSITLIWLFSRCLWGGKRTSLSNQLLWFNFNWHWLGLLNDWNDSWKRRTRGPRDFALSQQRMISMQTFLMKSRADFSLILSSVRLPQQTLVRVQHACDDVPEGIFRTLLYSEDSVIFQGP